MGLNLNYEPEVVVEDVRTLTRQQWLKERRKGIGGSDAGVVYGLSKYKTRKDLWLDKRGLIPEEEDDVNSWLTKEFGNSLEELVAMLFQKVTGYEVFKVPKMFRHPLYPYMLADVDYFVRLPDGRIFILECKTCNPDKLYMDWGAKEDTKIPVVYEWQGRHYMAVCNIDGVFYACLSFNKLDGFRIRFMERNYELEEELICEEGKFWQMVVDGIEPTYSSEPTDAILKSILKRCKIKEETVDLPDQYKDVIKRYHELDELRKAASRKADSIKTMQTDLLLPIIELLDGKQGVIEVDGAKFTVQQKRSNRTSIKKDKLALLKQECPDLYDRYVTPTDSQTIAVEKAA